MTVFTLEAEQWIPGDVETVFAFFSNAANLERLTPPWLHFRILDPLIEIRQGARIDYRLRLHGIPFRWQSQITVWDPPGRFVDEQSRGPYRLWRHEHSFEARDGGTLVHDSVRYAVLGGALVQRLFVAPNLEKIFSFRRARLESIFVGLTKKR